MIVLGVDIGSTGVKTTAFDSALNVLGHSYESYDDKVLNTGDKYEIDIENLVQKTFLTIKNTVKHLVKKDIASICITSFGETFVVLDDNDKVLINPMLYADKRGNRECKVLVDQFSDDFFIDNAGVYPNGMYSLPKLKWLYDKKPDVVEKISLFMSVASYVLYRLGAEPSIDYSLAARTMAFNIHKKQWMYDCFEAVGIKQESLPKLVPSGTVVGKLSSSVMRELNISNQPLLIVGGHDQVMSAVGGGIYKSNQAINTIGTVDCFTFSFSDPDYSKQLAKYNISSIPYLNTDLFISYAFNISGGAILNWFVKTFNVSGQNVYKDLDMSIPDDPSEIFVIPFFSGSGTPDLNANHKGIIYGLSLNSSMEAIYKACLEGISFSLKRNIEIISSIGIRINEMRAVGGGAKSDTWMQMRSNIFNTPIATLMFNEAGTLGTAIISLCELGVYTGVEEISRNLIKIKNTINPNSVEVLRYEQQYKHFIELLNKYY